MNEQKKKKGQGGALVTIRRRDAAASQPFWTSIWQSTVRGISDHVPQFLVVHWGALVSYAFQYYGKMRDAVAQQAKFEKDSFLQVRSDVDRLITNGIVIMERIRALIGSGDYHGAKKLKSENDQLRQEWNTAVNARFLSPLGRLEDCQSAGYQTPAVDPDAQENCNSLPSRDCLLDFFYDLADEKQVSQTDYVQNPRSLHFAFRNAGLTLDKIFRSEWGDCRQLMNDHLLRQLYRCKQATTPDTEHDLEAQITCLAKARDQNQKDLLSCKNRKGSELQKQLREELNCVRERWTPLHNRFYRLEKRMEAGG